MHPIISGFKFERNLNLYKNIWVHQFKKIVPFGDLWIELYDKLFSKHTKIINSKQKAVVWFIFTLSVEFIHALGFVVILVFSISEALDANYYALAKWTIINIVVNVYPILVQRYNRTRLIRAFNITREDIDDFEIKM